MIKLHSYETSHAHNSKKSSTYSPYLQTSTEKFLINLKTTKGRENLVILFAFELTQIPSQSLLTMDCLQKEIKWQSEWEKNENVTKALYPIINQN